MFRPIEKLTSNLVVMSKAKHSSSGLTVIRPGVQSSLQDLGRFGVASQGLSQGGAMDLHAHCWANKILENSVSCPTLEIVIGLAEFKAESDLQLALAGAEMQAHIDGEAVGNWFSFSLLQGQTLTLKAAISGMRSYLAVSGGFQIEPILGSVSTVVRNQLGGLDGDMLQTDDFLPTKPHVSYAASLRSYVPRSFLPEYSDTMTLRVIESYQSTDFSPQELKKFYQSEYILTQDCDRMGARLTGEPINAPTGLISEGIALGAIQVPVDGQPIILLNDRQTLGGYPKIGCVARVDLPKLAQARPGTRIGFTPVVLVKARDEWQEFSRYFGSSLK